MYIPFSLGKVILSLGPKSITAGRLLLIRSVSCLSRLCVFKFQARVQISKLIISDVKLNAF